MPLQRACHVSEPTKPHGPGQDKLAYAGNHDEPITVIRRACAERMAAINSDLQFVSCPVIE
jgi:hypothetical protein